MEEKKTKKMTKAEAFEWLKNAKIYVDSQIVPVSEKLFKIGFTWGYGEQDGDLGWSSDDEAYGLIIGDGKLSWVDKPYCGSWFDNLAMPRELRAADILSIEIVEEKKGDERKGKILNEIAKLGEKISDLVEEYEGNIVIEINQYEVLLRDSGDILYRK